MHEEPGFVPQQTPIIIPHQTSKYSSPARLGWNEEDIIIEEEEGEDHHDDDQHEESEQSEELKVELI